jgi:hypothetical protein
MTFRISSIMGQRSEREGILVEIVGAANRIDDEIAAAHIILNPAVAGAETGDHHQP